MTVRIVKVGDTVIWRGGWGEDEPKEAVISSIELCENEHEKYGDHVDVVSVEDLNRCCVGLTNDHWAYGYQITPIPQSSVHSTIEEDQ